jgi:hypothetical protein
MGTVVGCPSEDFYADEMLVTSAVLSDRFGK